ncbi:MAG: glycosyltransferase family 4 protein [bacterium]|nr:glycosyltransferase family 4 protein [bacterium]
MKIILAAGVFYPDVGGPAIHVRKIAEAFTKNGWSVKVITYGHNKDEDNFPFVVSRVSRSYPGFLRWLIYFIKMFFSSFNAGAIYAFDPTAAGLPAALAAKILRKKFIIRLGGDPIWERVVERGERFLSLEDYYEQKLHLQDKPRLFKLIRWVMKSADRVVVYSQFFKDFCVKYLGVEPNRIEIIANPVTRREDASMPKEIAILFAGRFVKYKNLEMLVEVFAKLRSKFQYGKLILIGHGPEEDVLRDLVENIGASDYIEILPSLPQEALFNQIRSAAVCIGPALSEFNPNFILECLSFGKPTILSKGNGLTVQLPEDWLFDPKSASDLENKLSQFFDKNFYEQSLARVKQLPMSQSWEKVVGEHIEIIKQMTKRKI